VAKSRRVDMVNSWVDVEDPSIRAEGMAAGAARLARFGLR
jgi:hypothetical protein